MTDRRHDMDGSRMDGGSTDTDGSTPLWRYRCVPKKVDVLAVVTHTDNSVLYKTAADNSCCATAAVLQQCSSCCIAAAAATAVSCKHQVVVISVFIVYFVHVIYR